MFFLEHIWIIPLLPAFGAAMMFLFGRKLSGIAPRPRYAESHDGDPHGPSPAVTHHDPHAAHGPSDAHEVHTHERHEWVNAICVGAVVLAFLFAVGCVWQLTHQWAAAHPGQPFETTVYTWLGSGTNGITFTTY